MKEVKLVSMKDKWTKLRKGTIKKCIICEKEYYCQRYAEERRCCSWRCRNIYMKDRNRKGKYTICVQCGKTFYLPRWRLKNNGKYCSVECQHEAHRSYKHSKKTKQKLKKGKYIKCLNCGKIVYKPKWDKNKKYCSRKCMGEYQTGKHRTQETIQKILKKLLQRPTSYEQKIIVLNSKHSKDVPFKYIGDGKEIVGYVNPDFIDTLGMNPHLIIETYTKWCHPENYEDTRHKQLCVPKKNVLFLSDEHLNIKDWERVCIKKIKEFVEMNV